MEIKRYDLGQHFARVTEYNGVLYFTGHIAAGRQPTMTEQMVAANTQVGRASRTVWI